MVIYEFEFEIIAIALLEYSDKLAKCGEVQKSKEAFNLYRKIMVIIGGEENA